MASTLGPAYLTILPDTSKFEGGLKSKLSSIGGLGVAAAGIVGVGAAVGGALLKIGSSFEESFNKIKVQTGATGVQLVGLETSFKNVFAHSASPMADVAAAVSEVSVRTHLTGTALDELSKKFVDLSRITGTDTAGNVKAVTALFGQFGVAAGQQSAELDVLYKASQKSGVSITDLTSALSAATPVAQTLGLNFDQTAALTAQLTAAGLPATKVMMGLGMEFAKAAKAGKDPTAVIGDMVTAIKAAPNATAAATLAIHDFGIGARQAATLVDAVRAGTLNFGATLAAITSGSGGIESATAATLTLGDKFKIFEHTALVAIEPVAMKVLDFANVLADKIPGAIDTVMSAIKPLFAALVAGFSGSAFSSNSGVARFFHDLGIAARDVFNFLAANGPPVLDALKGAFDKIVGIGQKVLGFLGENWKATLAAIAVVIGGVLVSAVVSFGVALVAAIGPADLIVAALAALAFGVVYAYTHFKGFRDVVNEVASFLKEKVLPVVKEVASWIGDHLKPILIGIGVAFVAVTAPIALVIGGLVYLYAKFGLVRDIVNTVAGVIVDVLTFAFKNVADVVGAVVGIFSDLISFVSDVFQGKWSDAFNALADIPQRVFTLIGQLVGNLIGFFEGLPPKLLSALGSLASSLLSFFASLPGKILTALGNLAEKLIGWVGQGITSLVAALPGLIGFLYGFFESLPIKLLIALGDATQWLIQKGVDALGGLLTGLWNALPQISAWLVALPGKILGFLGDVTVWLIETGVKLLTGLVTGLINDLPALAFFLGALPGKIISLLGDVGSWLLDVGGKILQGLWNGMLNGLKDAGSVLGKIKDGIVNGIKSGFGIFSPSRVFQDIGGNLMEGLAAGIGNNAKLPQGALNSLKLNVPQIPGTNIAGGVPTGLVPFGGAPPIPGSSGTLDRTNDILNRIEELLRLSTEPPVQINIPAGMTPPQTAQATVAELRKQQWQRLGR